MISGEEFTELDLRIGDFIKYREDSWPQGTFLTGPLIRDDDGCLCVGPFPVQLSDNLMLPPFPWPLTIVVLERAPRQAYVNHEREEPVPGDIARDADTDSRTPLYLRGADKWLVIVTDRIAVEADVDQIPPRLRLLVDGDTGTAVPPVA